MARRRDFEIRIDSIFPSAAIPGGQIMVRGSGMAAEPGKQPEVSFGDARGRLILSGPERSLVCVPSEAEDDEFRITVGKTTAHLSISRSAGNSQMTSIPWRIPP